MIQRRNVPVGLLRSVDGLLFRLFLKRRSPDSTTFLTQIKEADCSDKTQLFNDEPICLSAWKSTARQHLVSLCSRTTTNFAG
jgi:hypothetical protein